MRNLNTIEIPHHSSLGMTDFFQKKKKKNIIH